MHLTADQVAALKASWPEVSAGDGGAQLGLEMFTKYFHENPQMMFIFGYSGRTEALKHSSKLQHHGKVIIDQIGKAVAEMDNAKQMAGTLHALGVRHKGFGDIRAEFFPALGMCLLDAMEEKVPGLNRTLWAAAYREISDACIAGLQS
uniref:Globin, major polymeric component P1 n=1 Tax=Glycera dibranchiata TaxID=6350 RepID=GLBP1_GLYDI|nr:RecName: Full=Globin, major polymeric component P1 [Glycera dibranchiata]CAA37995.1 globin P1 [Glycera dibranchiata]